MTVQWVGVILVLVGCGSFGLSMNSGYNREIRLLQELNKALNDMEWELQDHLTPLSELCCMASESCSGILHQIFLELSKALCQREHPDVKHTMEAILRSRQMPKSVRRCLKSLGSGLGRFDLTAQIQGIRCARGFCLRKLNELEKNKPERVRAYQTLALCAGAAIAIILL